MKNRIKNYHLLADLFDYPEADFTQKLTGAQSYLSGQYPDAGAQLKPFTEYMCSVSLIDQQELFIRSFDVQAVTTLDLGFVLFGDDYKRGELLVNLNREHNQVGNECGNELADHLSNVLRLLPKLMDELLIAELVAKIIAPSLRKMIRAFEPDRIEMKETFYKKKYKTLIDRPEDHYTIYQRALEALYAVLKVDFYFDEVEPENKRSDFLKNIKTEVKLEG